MVQKVFEEFKEVLVLKNEFYTAGFEIRVPPLPLT